MKGHIRKRGKNSWAIMLSFKDAETGGWKQKQWTIQGNKKDAERKRRELLYQIDLGSPVEPSRQTVSDLLERWLNDWAADHVRAQTYRRYSIIVRRRLIPLLGRHRLMDLQPVHIAAAIKSWNEEGLAPRTVLYHFRILSQALRQAVRWQILTRNPADAVDPPKVGQSKMVALDSVQLQAVLEASEPDRRLTGLVYFSAYTGLRQGEQLGLRWQDVDLDRGVSHIRHSLQWLPQKGFDFVEPKSAAGRRRVDLPPSVVRLLRSIRAEQAEARLRMGPAYRDHDLVFCGMDGSPIDPNNLRKRFKKAVQSARISKCRWHDLRHTHASLMLEQGVHPKIVQERLGHASIQQTLDTYSHVLPSLQESAAERFDEWFGNVTKVAFKGA